MVGDEREEKQLRSVALQNAQSILAARQRAEQELLEAKDALGRQSEWLRIALASIGDAVISTDEQGRVTFLNGVAEALTGWPQADAAGRPLPDIFHIVHEQSRLPAENPALRALQEGTVVALANRTILIARDGTERPIDDSAAPMRGKDGSAVGAVLVFRDVTERKRAQRDQARLAAIVESSEDAIVSKTLDGIIQTWNIGAERLFGYLPQEAVGKHITLIIPKELWEEERMILSRLSRGERIEHFETVRQTKDGRLIDISLRISPIHDAEGRVIGASKVARDITARKRAEEALHESQERQRKLADNLPLGFIYQITHTGDGSRHFTYVSGGVQAITGLTPGEILADPMTLYGMIVEEDRPFVQAAEEAAYRCQGRFDCQFRTVTPEGKLRWLHCRSAPRRLPSGGEVWDGMALDVTERRLAEEALRENEERYRQAAAEAARAAEANAKFRAFFEQGTNFAGVLSLDGTVVEANRLSLEACGYARANVIGRLFWKCGWWSPSAILVNMVREGCIQAAAGQIFRTETLYFLADGTERIVDLILAPVASESGTILFVAATGVDVTERRRMEDSLRAADRKKDEFIALLAHELRNPLAPIRNGLQVMRLAGGDAGAADRARAMMDRQLSHMVRLIDDLLDVSRINSNKMELRRTRVLLADVVSSAVETARPVIDAEAHELTVSLPQQPLYLDADLTRLAQVFSNLLTNSAKYTERGGCIWLAAERHGATVAVSVRDTGIGIPSESLASIFDMFAQVDRPTERASGGLGIGLALVKGVVEMHGGTVSAESGGQGRGSTFTVILPIIVGPEDAALTQAPDGGHATKGPKRRILVVDDSRDGADSLALMLRLMGNEVRTAYDGVEAVEAAPHFLPDVILMDVGMPRLNGLDATRRIRLLDCGKAMTIIALTGWGQEGDRERSRAAGCDGHLVKPVHLPDLEKMLNDLAGPRRQT